jgi:hypothetical protein
VTGEDVVEDGLDLLLVQTLVDDGGQEMEVDERGDLAGQEPRPTGITCAQPQYQRL